MKIQDFRGKAIVVRGNEIDTDRIIPARFMKCTTFEGLGIHAFHDERVDGKGRSKKHPFDDPRWAFHPVLVVNANFGCGSSREHAPQALRDYGIRAIIGESFAEIFAGNCLSLGIPAPTLSAKNIATLQKLIENEPEIDIHIDLLNMKIAAGKTLWPAIMPHAHRNALLDGSWDSTALLAANADEIERVAASLPYL